MRRVRSAFAALLQHGLQAPVSERLSKGAGPGLSSGPSEAMDNQTDPKEAESHNIEPPHPTT
jgi:hypothetical protein